MTPRKSRCTNFQNTLRRLQHLVDVASTTEARFAARSLISQLEVIRQEFPDLTIRQLLTPTSEGFD